MASTISAPELMPLTITPPATPTDKVEFTRGVETLNVLLGVDYGCGVGLPGSCFLTPLPRRTRTAPPKKRKDGLWGL